MNPNWLRRTLFGLTLCLASVNAIAGDAVVRQYGDWTVTITPKKKSNSGTVDRRKSDTNVLPAVESKMDRPAPDNSRIVIQPISFQATEANQVAAPVPEEVVPARDPAALPPVSSTPTALPFPTNDNAQLTMNNSWGPIMITPGPHNPDITSTVVIPQTASYRDIYFSIPFSRAEYNANPSYRHDATMEVIFNQMRPTVIQRSTTNVYNYDMNSGVDPMYYPYGFGLYGLRIHRSR